MTAEKGNLMKKTAAVVAGMIMALGGPLRPSRTPEPRAPPSVPRASSPAT